MKECERWDQFVIAEQNFECGQGERAWRDKQRENTLLTIASGTNVNFNFIGEQTAHDRINCFPLFCVFGYEEFVHQIRK